MGFSIARLRPGGALAVVVLLLTACVSTDPNIAMTEEAVTAIPVGEAAAVSAYDLAKAMLRAGFSRQDILEHGTAVRNALATSGGAQVRKGKFVEALFSVHSGHLYATSRLRGTFVQELGSEVSGQSLALKQR